MAGARQILFIQGGGMGAHDHWDNKLVESVSQKLGEGAEVRYPRTPEEDDPSSGRWSQTIRREMADLADGAVVVGHSVGATILVNALVKEPPERELEAIVLIGAPFVGEGGWASDGFELVHKRGGVGRHSGRSAMGRAVPVTVEDLARTEIPSIPARQAGSSHRT